MVVPPASRGPALAQTSSAGAVGPRSDSSSQAQVAPPAPGRVAEIPGAMRSTSTADVCALAASLWVIVRANLHSVGALRAVCSRDLYAQRCATAYVQLAVTRLEVRRRHERASARLCGGQPLAAHPLRSLAA